MWAWISTPGDAEHHQDHADLGQLLREFLVRDESGRRGPDQDARDQVADERRKPETRGDESEQERKSQRGGQGGNQRYAVRHDGTASVPRGFEHRRAESFH